MLPSGQYVHPLLLVGLCHVVLSAYYLSMKYLCGYWEEYSGEYLSLIWIVTIIINTCLHKASICVRSHDDNSIKKLEKYPFKVLIEQIKMCDYFANMSS